MCCESTGLEVSPCRTQCLGCLTCIEVYADGALACGMHRLRQALWQTWTVHPLNWLPPGRDTSLVCSLLSFTRCTVVPVCVQSPLHSRADNPKVWTRCGHHFHMQCIYEVRPCARRAAWGFSALPTEQKLAKCCPLIGSQCQQHRCKNQGFFCGGHKQRRCRRCRLSH